MLLPELLDLRGKVHGACST